MYRWMSPIFTLLLTEQPSSSHDDYIIATNLHSGLSIGLAFMNSKVEKYRPKPIKPKKTKQKQTLTNRVYKITTNL